MFEWSRGSIFKAMRLVGIPHASYDPFLKGFAYAWLHAVLKFEAGASVLDVGCGASPTFVDDLRTRYGVEPHGMDKGDSIDPRGWGLTATSAERFPHVVLHDTLAGEERGPADYFDAVISVSALEHIYDQRKPIDRDDMYPHYRAFRDMARMVKPGGILAFAYDFPLCYPYNPGWSPLADFEYLLVLGLQPCCWTRLPPSETFIFNQPDTLFTHPEPILDYCDYYFRIAILCFAFWKPGPTCGVTYAPHQALRPLLESGPVEYPTGKLPTPSDPPGHTSSVAHLISRVKRWPWKALRDASS